MNDTIASQNTDRSSRITLYMYEHIYIFIYKLDDGSLGSKHVAYKKDIVIQHIVALDSSSLF